MRFRYMVQPRAWTAGFRGIDLAFFESISQHFEVNIEATHRIVMFTQIFRRRIKVRFESTALYEESSSIESKEPLIKELNFHFVKLLFYMKISNKCIFIRR